MIKEEEIRLQIDIIKRSNSLPSPPPSPILPNLQGITLTRHKIEIIQKFINSFQYNYTGQPFVKMNKSRGMSHISSCSKEIIRLGLPIQCIEAVFLGCFLTADLSGVDRLPLSFKSKCDDNSYRHIVLALRYENKWGAIGISRRSNLMYKEIEFNSFYDLIIEYKKSYSLCGHRLIKVYIGLPFSHDVFCDMPIKWRVLKHTTYDSDLPDLRIKLDNYSSNMLRIFEFFRREGVLPPSPKKKERIPSSIIPAPPPLSSSSITSTPTQKRCKSLPRSSRRNDKSNELNDFSNERRRGRSKHRTAIDNSHNYEEGRLSLSYSLTRNSTPSLSPSHNNNSSYDRETF